jgi:hypothetical protein
MVTLVKSLSLKSRVHWWVCYVMTRLQWGMLLWRRPCNALKAMYPRLPLTLMRTWTWDQISVPAFTLAFTMDVQQGSCADQGCVYPKYAHCHAAIQSRAASSACDGSDTCWCRGGDVEFYEHHKLLSLSLVRKIACPKVETDAVTLYLEHVEAIETHCQGVISGSDDVCPYLCFQPKEVLHLHYPDCPTRPIDPTDLAVNGTVESPGGPGAEVDRWSGGRLGPAVYHGTWECSRRI